jgi:hypothetical protein
VTVQNGRFCRAKAGFSFAPRTHARVFSIVNFGWYEGQQSIESVGVRAQTILYFNCQHEAAKREAVPRLSESGVGSRRDRRLLEEMFLPFLFLSQQLRRHAKYSVSGALLVGQV